MAAAGLTSLQIQQTIFRPLQTTPFKLNSHKHPTLTSQKPNTPKIPLSKKPQNDDGIPTDEIKTLAKFKTRHNSIKVLEISRKSDHPFAGSRLLLLDTPGNIHSINFNLKLLTDTYFDVFATFPPILPPGPLGILGFGAGSAAKLILEIYPQGVIHGWEIDPAVIAVGREFFGVEKMERLYSDRLYVHVGDALNAEVECRFSGLLVDLFSEGCVIPELRDPETWRAMKRKLKDGGRVMVNVGGSCVEAEDEKVDGRVVMMETLEAMESVFPGEVSVLSLGRKKDDSSIAVTGKLPDLEVWKRDLPKSLRFYVDMWKPFTH